MFNEFFLNEWNGRELIRLHSYYQSGYESGFVQEEFFVEDRVQQIAVNWLCNKKDLHIQLMDPRGQTLNDFSLKRNTELFQYGFTYRKIIKNPSPGRWRVMVAMGEEPGPFILTVHFSSKINQDQAIITTATETINIFYMCKQEFTDPKGINLDILLEFISPRMKKLKRIRVDHLTNSQKLVIPPFADGVYNLTIQVEGKTKTGYAFQRTVLESVYCKKT